jgi:hypothetical protein
MMCAIMGLSDEIEMIDQIIDYYSDLAPLKEQARNLKKTHPPAQEVVSLVQGQQGILQTDLKGRIHEADGRTISTICYYLDKYNRITRNKTGKTYSLCVT